MSMKKLGLFLVLFFYLIFILIYPHLIKDNIINTCLLFVTIVMPSILPMYLIGNLLMNTKLVSSILYPLLKKIFHFENQNSCSIYLLSLIMGNPTTSILIDKAIQSNSISIYEGRRLMGFTFFMNPLFILNVCNKQLAIPIIIGSIFTSIIIAYLSKISSSYINATSVKNSIWSTLEKAPTTLLNILIMMIAICIIKTPLTLLNQNNLVVKYLGDLLEISTGLISVVKYSLPQHVLIILLCLLINSNGLCLFMQTIQVSSFITLKSFFIKRLISTIISIIVTLAVYFLFYR